MNDPLGPGSPANTPMRGNVGTGAADPGGRGRTLCDLRAGPCGRTMWAGPWEPGPWERGSGARVRGGLGADEARDGVRGLAHLRFGLRTPALDGFRHAMAKMILKQPQGDRLQRSGHGGHLGEHVDAVRIVAHHTLQPSHLAFDASQPLEVGVLILCVPAHAAQSTLTGYLYEGR